MKFPFPAHWGHAPQRSSLILRHLIRWTPSFHSHSIAPSRSPTGSRRRSAEIKMDVSPAEIGRYGKCKAKMWPDISCIDQPIRELLLPQGPRQPLRRHKIDSSESQLLASFQKPTDKWVNDLEISSKSEVKTWIHASLPGRSHGSWKTLHQTHQQHSLHIVTNPALKVCFSMCVQKSE